MNTKACSNDKCVILEDEFKGVKKKCETHLYHILMIKESSEEQTYSSNSLIQII